MCADESILCAQVSPYLFVPSLCDKSCFLVLSLVPKKSCSCFLVLSKNRALDCAFWCSPSCKKWCSKKGNTLHTWKSRAFVSRGKCIARRGGSKREETWHIGLNNIGSWTLLWTSRWAFLRRIPSRWRLLMVAALKVCPQLNAPC